MSEEKLKEVNGKVYPMLNGIVEKKDQWIGGTLQDFGDSFLSCNVKTEIIDITLEPNGDDSAMFSVIGKDFNCTFDVQHGGVIAGEEGYLTFGGYEGHTFRIKEKEMDKEKLDRHIGIMEMIATDMENDAEEFDGKPFTGKTVADYFGRHGAAIAVLAETIKLLAEELKRVDM